MKPDEILQAAADTFRERNAVYASNHEKVGEIMNVLFPHGVHLNSALAFERWHIFELIIIKLTRFVNADMSHKDSVRDIAVYAAILEMLIDKKGKS